MTNRELLIWIFGVISTFEDTEDFIKNDDSLDKFYQKIVDNIYDKITDFFEFKENDKGNFKYVEKPSDSFNIDSFTGIVNTPNDRTHSYCPYCNVDMGSLNEKIHLCSPDKDARDALLSSPKVFTKVIEDLQKKFCPYCNGDSNNHDNCGGIEQQLAGKQKEWYEK